MKEPKHFVQDFNFKEKSNSIVGQQLEYIFINKVAGYTLENRQSGNSKAAIYECTCKCGNTFLSRARDIKRGKTKSCGCVHKERARLLGLSNKKGKGDSGANVLYSRYKRRSLVRGMEFNLKFDEFKNIITQNCYYCNSEPRELSLSYVTSEHGKIDFNGVDRLDNNVGYTIENSVPCCSKCNYAKHTNNVTDFIEHIKAIYNNIANIEDRLLTSQSYVKEDTKNKNATNR